MPKPSKAARASACAELKRDLQNLRKRPLPCGRGSVTNCKQADAIPIDAKSYAYANAK
jgi:hypothetical protein